MSDTVIRARVATSARTDWRAALAECDTIQSPWFKCQAISYVARHAPDYEVDHVIASAMSAASAGEDAYQQVGASAWALNAAVHRQSKALPAILTTLLTKVAEVEPPASRSEALFLLFQAAFPAGDKYWLPIFSDLQHASQPLEHWRQARNYRDAVMMVASANKTLALQAAAAIVDTKLRRQTERWLSEGRFLSPRGFA